MNDLAAGAPAPPATQRVMQGQPAAPGLACGPLVELKAPAREPAAGAAPTHPMRLPQAIAEAVRALSRLRDAAADEAARRILDFQVEFLGDPVLLEPVQAQLDAGDDEAAWCEAIDAQIADFNAADDEYFRHRASDLRDMRARVLALVRGEPATEAVELPAGAVVLADDLAPSAFLATRWQPGQALLLRGGSPTAHVALLARASGLPMVVALGALPMTAGQWAIVDGSSGEVRVAPDDAARTRFARQQHDAAARCDAEALAAKAEAGTASGERVQVMINIAAADELDAVDPAICDGIGLVRTELMFAAGAPDEATQLALYLRLLAWAGPRPVVVRTLDAGGDKPMPGITVDGESHPFLGLRGIRLSLRNPALFKVQLRALLRAAAAGDLRVMLPMVTHGGELREARTLLYACRDELQAEGLAHRLPPLGVMIEVPAAALAIGSLGAPDFASIGSNDLLQYTMAAARDNAAVSALADPAHPGFRRLLEGLVHDAAAAGIALSLCGDLAAQRAQVPALLALGLRSLSVPAAAVGAVKQSIAAWGHPGGPAV